MASNQITAKDPKTDYLFESFRHTQKKVYENYVVLGIWHRLRIKGLDIKPVTQQCVRREAGSYALLDLYFPGLNLAVECDEAYHRANKENDALRERDIFKAFGEVGNDISVHRAEDLLKEMDAQTSTMTKINAELVDISRLELARVAADLTYPEIDKQLDSIVNIIVQRFEKANRPTWDMSKPQDIVEASGKITMDMGLIFPKKIDILKALNIRTVKGSPYKSSPQQGSVKVSDEPYTRIWFANVALDNKGAWKNILRENGNVIEEQSRGELNKSARNHWMRACRMASESKGVYRVTFAKARNGLAEKGHRFMGVFQLVGGWDCKGNDVELKHVNGGYCLTWKRIATEFARLPDPETRD